MLRRTLRIKASMISHVSDERIPQLFSTTPLSEQLQCRQLHSFGHVSRSGKRRSPIYSVCFDHAGRLRILYRRRKIGHPRQKWAKQLITHVLHVFKHFGIPCKYNAHRGLGVAWAWPGRGLVVALIRQNPTDPNETDRLHRIRQAEPDRSDRTWRTQPNPAGPTEPQNPTDPTGPTEPMGPNRTKQNPSDPTQPAVPNRLTD